MGRAADQVTKMSAEDEVKVSTVDSDEESTDDDMPEMEDLLGQPQGSCHLHRVWQGRDRGSLSPGHLGRCRAVQGSWCRPRCRTRRCPKARGRRWRRRG